MTDQQPVEPSALVDRDGVSVPYPRTAPRGVVRLSRALPVLARAVTAGPVLTASAIGLTAVATAKALEMAGRMAWQTGRDPAGGTTGPRTAPGYLEVTWTRVEIRWPG